MTDDAAIPLDYKNVTVKISAAMWDEILNAFSEGNREVVLSGTTNDLSVTIDKVAIKESFQAGYPVSGARLIEDKTTLGRK